METTLSSGLVEGHSIELFRKFFLNYLAASLSSYFYVIYSHSSVYMKLVFNPKIFSASRFNQICNNWRQALVTSPEQNIIQDV